MIIRQITKINVPLGILGCSKELGMRGWMYINYITSLYTTNVFTNFSLGLPGVYFRNLYITSHQLTLQTPL